MHHHICNIHHRRIIIYVIPIIDASSYVSAYVVMYAELNDVRASIFSVSLELAS